MSSWINPTKTEEEVEEKPAKAEHYLIIQVQRICPQIWRKMDKDFRWRCAQGTHPFPSRTRWLRPKRPMVLYWRRYGRVGGCQIIKKKNWSLPVIRELKRFNYLMADKTVKCLHCTSRTSFFRSRAGTLWNRIFHSLWMQAFNAENIRFAMYLENCIQRKND